MQNEGFDETFEPVVAGILNEFMLMHDPHTERGWIAHRGKARLGSVFCTREGAQTARLRLFLVLPEARRTGLGRRMVHTLLEFANTVGYKRVRLNTHESHVAACALYRAMGWQLVEQIPVHNYGRDLVEQTWEFTF